MGNLAGFEHYIEHLCEVLGHVDRSTGFRDYFRGLMLPIARKSIEPLASCSDPDHLCTQHTKQYAAHERTHKAARTTNNGLPCQATTLSPTCGSKPTSHATASDAIDVSASLRPKSSGARRARCARAATSESDYSQFQPATGAV